MIMQILKLKAQAMFIGALLMFSPAIMRADDTSTSTTTTTTRWQGTDVTKLTSSDQFFLYNVGTGRFAMQGGLWGHARHAALSGLWSCHEHRPKLYG